MDFEIIVIGAGPAGAMATKELAERGFKVLCIEKEIEVGYTNKSTAATPISTFDIFELPRELGFEDLVGARVFGPTTNCTLDFPRPIGRLLRFRETKQYLIQEAIRAGAVVWLGTAVTGAVMKEGRVAGVKYKGYEGEGELIANAVVDASGPASVLAEGLGLWEKKPESLGVAFEYFMDNAAPIKSSSGGYYMDFFMGNHIAPGGYGWIFPTGETQVKAGMCKLNPMLKPDGEKTQKDYFNDIWKNNEQIKNAQPFELHQCEHYIVGSTDHAVLNNFLAIGDAISKVHPIFGEGCRAAFYSARFATQALELAREQNDYSEKTLALYDKLWGKQWGGNWRLSTTAYKIMYSASDDKLDIMIKLLPKISSEVLYRIYLGTATKTDYLTVVRQAAGSVSAKSLKMLFETIF